MRTTGRAWGVAMLVCLAWLPLAAAATEAPTVAAASDLQFALKEVAERFRAETGQSVRLNFGSSGNFRRQITQGAPFELYLSADEAYIEALHQAGFTEDAGVRYAQGRLAWLQRDTDEAPDEAAPLAAVKEAITAYAAGDRLSRIALANPEHAPYGVAARQALSHAGLWEATQPIRVLGENVAQAAQFALAGDAQGGLVAYSLALAPSLKERSHYVLIPQEWHDPLYQRMALIRDAGETARDFYTYLQQDVARDILAEYGFTLPESVPSESD